MATGAFVVGRHSSNGDDYGNQAAAVFARPDTLTTTLGGTGQGSFKVAWSASGKQAVVVGDGLADPGAGKAYELWLIDDAGAHAVRLLDKGTGGQVRRIVSVDGSPAKWAITVEPQTGVDAPTGEVIFSGAV